MQSAAVTHGPRGAGHYAISTASTQVNAQPVLSADVLDSSDPVRPGQEFVYTIQYRNNGTAPATGLRITETYPSQVTYVSANPAPCRQQRLADQYAERRHVASHPGDGARQQPGRQWDPYEQPGHHRFE
jgi:uncharacterized repeat protein (TIGR01451 family)